MLFVELFVTTLDRKMWYCIVNTEVKMINFQDISCNLFAGLGEVSESLLKDDNLTPADFCYKKDVSQDICSSQQASSDNDCLSGSKIVHNDKFKTPLSSKYKNSHISETPCLFSQDESITHTPSSSEWFVFVEK